MYRGVQGIAVPRWANRTPAAVVLAANDRKPKRQKAEGGAAASGAVVDGKGRDDSPKPRKRGAAKAKPEDVTALLALEARATELSHRLFPAYLGDHDVVITTYEALSTDIHNVEATATDGRTMRTEKRYRVCPSPLLQAMWWRVCLDEAQIVEKTLPTSDMARRLWCVNRWCVSGTPIKTGFADLKGLFMFLRLEPFCSPLVFDKWYKPQIEAGSVLVRYPACVRVRSFSPREGHLRLSSLWKPI